MQKSKSIILTSHFLIKRSYLRPDRLEPGTGHLNWKGSVSPKIFSYVDIPGQNMWESRFGATQKIQKNAWWTSWTPTCVGIVRKPPKNWQNKNDKLSAITFLDGLLKSTGCFCSQPVSKKIFIQKLSAKSDRALNWKMLKSLVTPDAATVDCLSLLRTDAAYKVPTCRSATVGTVGTLWFLLVAVYFSV